MGMTDYSILQPAGIFEPEILAQVSQKKRWPALLAECLVAFMTYPDAIVEDRD